jgi:hypothetical protein
METYASVLPKEKIIAKIFLIRGIKVMLDSDLAEFYGVLTKELNKAVARNLDRFPNDFMFQLTLTESRQLNTQLGIERDYGGRRTLPYAFTEQGVAMLSAVLKSERAVLVSVQIMRSFVQLRQLLLSNEALARRLKALEARSEGHAKVIVQIIQELHNPPVPKKNRIGF